jgi:hypothetical protein
MNLIALQSILVAVPTIIRHAFSYDCFECTSSIGRKLLSDVFVSHFLKKHVHY